MIDWTASGIQHQLEFWLVDSRTLEEVSLLDGVTSFSLSESWRGDFRQTGQLDLDGETLPLWGAVRVYMTSSLGSEVEREELCTLLPEPAGVELEQGRVQASYDLKSMMWKLDTNLQPVDKGIAAGTDIAAHFAQVVGDSGAVPYVHPGVGGSTRSARVWEAGDSCLTEAHAMANACNGRVEPDSHGHVCLVPYQNPARISDSFDIPAGAASVVLPGLSEDAPEICNRVIASYSQDDSKWFASATVDPTHPWSYETIGRYETMEVSPPQIKEGDSVQAVLDALVVQTLREHSQTQRTWSVEMLYMPIRPGRAGTLEYVDGTVSQSVRGFVSARSLDWSGASLTMELEIEEV